MSATPNIQDMHTNALVPMDYVVRSFMNERDDFNLDNYERYMQIIRDGYTSMSIHRLRSVKVAYVTVNDVNIASLPPDFIDYYRIGMVFDGKVFELGLNRDLNIPKNEVCGVEGGNPDNLDGIDSPYWYEPTYSGGYNLGKYRLDMNRRLIIFDGDMASNQIVIEYISSGISITGKTFIPREVVPVLKAYLNWIIKERSDKVAMGEKMRAQQLYNIEEVRLNNFLNSFTMEEFLDAWRSGQHRGVKR